MKRLSLFLTGLLMFAVANAAGAASCAVSATGVAFGSYNRLNLSPLDTAGSVTMTCTAQNILGLVETVNYNVQLSAGAAGSYAPRRMSSGANQLSYNLHADATQLTVWGNGTAATSVVPGTLVVRGPLLILGQPETKSQNHTIYGRVPAGQNVPPGSYSDTITVTVNY